METKSILTSKTIWVNLIAVIAMLAQSKFGFVIDAEAQAAILMVANIILRIITKKAIDFKGQDKKIISGLILVMISSGIMSGCGTTGGIICSNIPAGQDSVICKIADRMNTTPEQISQILQVANFASLESDEYTATEAGEFVDRIIQEVTEFRELNKSLTYIEAINYLNSKFNLLSPRSQIVFSIISPGILAQKEIDIPLSDYDLSLILRHLEKQKNIIAAYL